MNKKINKITQTSNLEPQNILIIDNYDSFTYNLYQNVGEIMDKKETPFTLAVVRNDEITLEEIKQRNYDRIIISPGPGDPSDKSYFGVCSDLLLSFSSSNLPPKADSPRASKPQTSNLRILGVCLGMQGMAHYFGGKVVRAKLPMHGKSSQISHDEKGLFKDLPQDIEVMRYHSLIAERDSLPKELIITAESKDTKEIMGLRHKKYPIEGIQFHPESFATEGGMKILENFLQ